MNKPALTQRQRDVLDFIAEYRRQHGYPPTIREMMARFGYRSPNGVCCHLKALKRKGLINWEPHSSRTITLTSEAEALLRVAVEATEGVRCSS